MIFRLLEEHSALIGGFEDGDNLDVQVVEQTIEDMCDQYEPAAGDMALTECDNQGKTTDMDNTNDCDDDSAEPSYPLAAEMSPRGYEEDSAVFWALAQSDEDNSSSNDDLDHAAPTISFGAEEDSSQGGSRLLQRYINGGPVVSLSTVSSCDLALPVSSEKERNDSCMGDPLARQSQPFFEKGTLQRRSSSNGDTQVRKFKSSSSDVTDDNVSHLKPFIVNRNLTHWYIVFQGCVGKASQVGSSSIPSDSIVHFTSLRGRSHDDNVESPFKNLAQTLLARNSGPSSFNAPLQERTYKKSESRLGAINTLHNSVIPKLKAAKEVKWTTYAAPVVSKSDSPLVPPLKKPPINDILFERGKENQPSRTALITQPSSSRSYNTTSFDGSSEWKTKKHDRSGQAKAGGFATASTERKYVESRSEVATSDDDDFMPSRVTAKNVPIVKKVSAKKRRC